MANNNLETTEKESKQYIVVMVGSEQYGIDISYIDNIVRMQKITRVPKVQTYFKGVINLRGEVVPVMSYRSAHDNLHKNTPGFSEAAQALGHDNIFQGYIPFLIHSGRSSS